jgi:RNA polymerase sigma-70 factor (family 1)
MQYNLLTDELLLKLLRVDDKEAFEEIYRRYWKQLAQLALSKLRSREEAEEVLQELFMSLWEKRNTHQIESLRTYLFGALKYQIIDHYKQQLRAAKYADFALHKAPVAQQSPETELHFQQINSLFEETLHQLPTKTSQIFKMSRLENKTIREISQALSVPERTVEYHITVSLRLLRLQLKDYLPTLAGAFFFLYF